MIRTLRSLYSLARDRNGYLTTTGWWRSRFENKPVDAAGAPIPWINYSALAFLTTRIQASMNVFEYGSGSSTLWWAQRVRRVVSCEHDSEWHLRVAKLIPNNVEILHASRENSEYAKMASRYPTQFDIIAIDGRDRVECARHSVSALKDDGVIVWDNTDRKQYQPGFDYLSEQGFRQIEFTGLAPLVRFECATSVFYRSANCLGL